MTIEDPVLVALSRAADEVSPEDIDTIIAFLRKSKRAYDSGVKPKKEGGDVDIVSVLKITPKATEGFKRRI